MENLLMTYARNLSKYDPAVVFVYRKVPYWFTNKEPATDLLPSVELEESFRRGNIGLDEFVSGYIAELEKLDPTEMYNKYRYVTLCGRAKPNNDTFDYRFVIAAWFRSHGIPVCEREPVAEVKKRKAKEEKRREREAKKKRASNEEELS